jgi:hypothetical protein
MGNRQKMLFKLEEIIFQPELPPKCIDLPRLIHLSKTKNHQNKLSANQSLIIGFSLFSFTKFFYMTIFPRKTILVSAALISIVIVSVAFSAPPEDKKFKNLKVLPKNISEKDLDSVMHAFTRGLGVRCDFCHVATADRKMDFASDAKSEKNIARKMIKMAKKINKKYFNYNKDDQGNMIQSLSCYSCHHGEAHPAKNPPPRQQQPGQPGQPQQQQQQQ